MIFLDLGPIDSAQLAELIKMSVSLSMELSKLAIIVALLRGFFNEMILKMIRTISFFLDGILMKLIEYFYHYFDLILNQKIFEGELLKNITTKIYIFIGILIFFKLSITVINYIINPDLLEQKGTSVEAIIKKIIISIISIVLIPFGFKIAYSLQDAILNDGIIEHVILGEEYNDLSKLQGREGKMIGFTVFNGFFNLNESVSNSKAKRMYNQAQKLYDIDKIGVANVNLQPYEGVYAYNYLPIISTICLLFVFYMMFKLTIELAVRSIKLGVLEIISPFVIASSIAGVEEEMALSRWWKNVFLTYISVFINVATLWFVVFIAKLITTDKILVSNGDLLLKTLIYCSLFVFINDAPKIFGDIFHIEKNSDNTKNLVDNLFRQTWSATKFVGGAALGLGLGTIGGLAGSLKQTGKTIIDPKSKGVDKVIASGNALSSGIKGGFKGAFSGAKGNLGGAYNAGLVTGAKFTKKNMNPGVLDNMLNNKKTTKNATTTKVKTNNENSNNVKPTNENPLSGDNFTNKQVINSNSDINDVKDDTVNETFTYKVADTNEQIKEDNNVLDNNLEDNIFDKKPLESSKKQKEKIEYEDLNNNNYNYVNQTQESNSKIEKVENIDNELHKNNDGTLLDRLLGKK